MPRTTIWIHLVFSTKNRQPFLISDIVRKKLFEHIFENAKSKGIVISCVNGYFDHVHVLFRLLPTQQISTIVQLIKGESAFWINSNKLMVETFSGRMNTLLSPLATRSLKECSTISKTRKNIISANLLQRNIIPF
jgi:REP element-mobilizing transposase RayT